MKPLFAWMAAITLASIVEFFIGRALFGAFDVIDPLMVLPLTFVGIAGASGFAMFRRIPQDYGVAAVASANMAAALLAFNLHTTGPLGMIAQLLSAGVMGFLAARAGRQANVQNGSLFLLVLAQFALTCVIFFFLSYL